MEHDHGSQTLVEAPKWGNLLGQFGHGAVIWALAASICVLLLCFTNHSAISKLRRILFYSVGISLIASFVALLVLSVKDQFQFEYIFAHSEHANPFAYKLSAIWTSQEGSFLLWAVTTSIWGIITLHRSGAYERGFTGAFVIVLGALAACLTFETPFNTIKEAVVDGKLMLPPDGRGMVPTLQNYWLVIHPPTMFLGFGALTVPFAYGVAAMLHGNLTDWVRQSRAVSLAGMSILGLGIVMGGLWAYESLGWGGFWAWDPVENVSLVPWLMLVVLTHGMIVQMARGQWKSVNLLLAGVPLLSFVYGTFLTRSGLLDGVSVHSFAKMDKNALIILRSFMAVSIFAYLGLYAFRGHKLAGQENSSEIQGSAKSTKADDHGGKTSPEGVNRTSFYQFGLLSMSLLAFVIAIGMSWPVITVLMNPKSQGASISEALYHKAVVWFFIGIMVPMAVAPYVSWKKESLASVSKRFWTIFNLSIASVGLMLFAFKIPGLGLMIEPGATLNGLFKDSKLPLQPVMAFLMLFCVFAGYTNLWRAIEIGRKSKIGIGPFVAHFGIAVLMGGLIISRGFEQSVNFKVQENRPESGLGYTVSFKDYDPDRYYDRNNVVKFDVKAPNGENFEISPTLYYYQSGNTEKAQTWPFIKRTLTHDTYFFMQAPIVEFFEEPLTIKPGETVTRNNVTVKFIRPTRKGQPGQPGAEFGADLEISYDGKTYFASPALKLGNGSLEPTIPKISDDFRAVITSMNAADKSVQFQLLVSPPLYPVQIFYKPMTGLVWLGTGIFTLGGLLSAFYRRSKKMSAEGDFTPKTATI